MDGWRRWVGDSVVYDRGRLANFFNRRSGIAMSRRGSAPTPRIIAGVRQAVFKHTAYTKKVASRQMRCYFLLFIITYPIIRARKLMRDSDSIFLFAFFRHSMDAPFS